MRREREGGNEGGEGDGGEERGRGGEREERGKEGKREEDGQRETGMNRRTERKTERGEGKDWTLLIKLIL